MVQFGLAQFFLEHPWQRGRLHRTHNAVSKEHRWFKPNWMHIFLRGG